jgi:hypothetical protein
MKPRNHWGKSHRYLRGLSHLMLCLALSLGKCHKLSRNTSRYGLRTSTMGWI